MPKMPVSDLVGEPGDSDYSSDSDQEMELAPSSPRKAKIVCKKSSSVVVKPKMTREQIIKEINQKLADGEDIDLKKYPPLFVVHFRGTHFFTGENFFDQEGRRAYRARIKEQKLDQNIYSPAIFELAGLNFGQKITKKDKPKIKAAIEKLLLTFSKLEAKKAGKAHWGTGTEHATLLDQHYQRYVNTYEEFRRESKKKKYACYKDFASTLNPYVSTADEAKHAIYYALGGKATLEQGKLSPTYNVDEDDENNYLRSKHPKVGYVQIVMHRVESYVSQRPIQLSTAHAGRAIDIKTRTLNERETTFKAYIPAENVVQTKIVRFPSFNRSFDMGFHSKKYGLDNSAAYSRYKKSIGSGEGNSGLVDKLTEHYEHQLLADAEKVAKQQGGYIVYLGLDGQLRSNLPTTADVTAIRSNVKVSNSLNELFTDNLKRYRDETLIPAEQLAVSSKSSKLAEKSTVMVQHEKLKLNIAARNFDYHDVPGDGYCFYHAVLHQLRDVVKDKKYLDETHLDLRNLALAEVKKNIEFYSEFDDSGDLVKTLKDDKYANEIMIRALVKVLKIKLVIIRGDDPAFTVIGDIQNPRHYLHLGYIPGTGDQNDAHYVSLVAKLPARNIPVPTLK